MKVGHVIGALGYGGVESMALHLLRRLPTDRIRSIVYYTGEEQSVRFGEFSDAAVRFHHCPYYPPHRIDFIRRLATVFRKDPVDAVLTYSFGNHAWICLAARLARIQRCYARVEGSPLRGFATRWRCLILAQLARPFCTGEVAISHCVRKDLVHGLWIPPSRIHVIENGCAVEEIAERAAAIRCQRIRGDIPNVLMIARMDDAKDHRTLIRACATLIHAGFAVRLRLAGEGPARTEHEALSALEGIGDAVEFLGNCTNVPELFGASDVTVLATNTEGFGLVLAEAMAAGTPIIATDLPVCREVLDSGRCGVLVPPRNPEALAGAIRRVLEDASLRQQITGAAAQRVRVLYDIRLAVDGHVQLFTAL